MTPAPFGVPLTSTQLATHWGFNTSTARHRAEHDCAQGLCERRSYPDRHTTFTYCFARLRVPSRVRVEALQECSFVRRPRGIALQDHVADMLRSKPRTTTEIRSLANLNAYQHAHYVLMKLLMRGMATVDLSQKPAVWTYHERVA